MGINEMIQREKDNHEKFKEELSHLISKYSMENTCDMPDFMIAEMVYGFLTDVGGHIKNCLKWYGKGDSTNSI